MEYVGLDDIRKTLISRLKKAIKTQAGSVSFHGPDFDFIDFLAILRKVGIKPRWFGQVWTLDHVIPLVFFDLRHRHQVILSNSPENLQWVPCWTNHEKGCLLPDPVPAELVSVMEHVRSNFKNKEFVRKFFERSKFNSELLAEARKLGSF
jgi:hypothetical protein